jgi:lysylphosphatidylglycerol synthetase-like protein (DUF2156 family)
MNMNTWNAFLDYLMNLITLKWVIIFFVAYFFIIWISIIVWVIKDISNRTDRLFLQILSIFVVFIFGPFWIFLYLLLRPSKTLVEKSYEEIENNLEILMKEILEKTKRKKKNKAKNL